MSIFKKSFFCLTVSFLVFVLRDASAQQKPTQKDPPPEVYSGKIIALSGLLAGKPTDLAVVIGRVSTPDELEHFEKLLDEHEGQGKLADELDKGYDIGAYRLAMDLALAIKIITVTKTEKGRQYFLVGTRIPQGRETEGKISPRDYRFVVIKLNLDEKGKGDGSYLSSVKLGFKNHLPDVMDYQTHPANITNVHPDHN
jgi:hypothetical protein